MLLVKEVYVGKVENINNIISNFPEESLEEILIYVSDIEKRIREKEKKHKIINKILEEDRDLLEKLAK